MSDLDELAAAGRAKREAQRAGAEAEAEAEKARPRSREPEQPPDERRRMLNAVAFNTIHGSIWTMMIGSFAALAFGTWALGPALGVSSEPAGAVGGAAALVWGLAWFWGLRRLGLAAERKWMLARPYELAPDRLFRALGKTRDKTFVTIVVEFRGPLDPSSRELLRDAGEGVHPLAKARFEGERLMITAALETKRKSRPGASSSDGDPYSNEPAYHFIRTVLRKGVELIHAQVPVERVKFELREG